MKKPWPYVLILLFSSFLLSYAPLTDLAWACLFLVGIVLPLTAACFFTPPPSRSDPFPTGQELWSPIPLWVWVLFLAFAAGLRFFRLTSLSTWPMPDEGLFSYFSIELCRKWQWKLFFTHAQAAVLTNWLLALFYKLFTPSLFSLWLFPAILSLLTLGVALRAAWKTLGPSFSLLLLTAGANCFPILYTAKFCEPAAMVLFWTVLTLACLALCAKEGRKGHYFLLGLVTVLGFFITIIWNLMAFSVAWAVLQLQWTKPRRPWRDSLFFWLPVIVLGGFYDLVYWQGTHFQHMQGLWAFQTDSTDQAPWEGLFRDITCLFWRPGPPSTYGPLWGGLLNPILNACFGWALVECFRNRRQPWVRWYLGSLILFVLPGLLARGFEVFRMGLAFPLLVLLSLLGMRSLLGHLPRKDHRWMAWLLLMATSTALDLYHLEGPYHRSWGTPGPFWRTIKSSELDQAYRVLRDKVPTWGKGLILSDLRPDPTDQTLTTAAFGFDGARNPGLPKEEMKWVAILVNANDKPFLAGRFPEAKWYWLSKFSSATNQPQVLGWIPLTERTTASLDRWIEASRRSQELTSAILDSTPGESQGPLLAQLLGLYPYFQGDPFLESCYWEKVVFHCKADHNEKAQLDALREGLRKGYPLPQFLNDEGVLLWKSGKKAEARKAFLAATRSPLDLTPAAENLAALEASMGSVPSSGKRF